MCDCGWDFAATHEEPVYLEVNQTSYTIVFVLGLLVVTVILLGLAAAAFYSWSKSVIMLR